MQLRRGLTVFSGVALLGLLSAVFAACAGQGEGERCDLVRAGNADCNSGLVCTNVSGLNTAICCPEDVASRTGACAGKQTTTGDTGTAAETSAETSTDTGSEAAADASETSVDAGADASETSADAGADAAETTSDAAEAG